MKGTDTGAPGRRRASPASRPRPPPPRQQLNRAPSGMLFWLRSASYKLIPNRVPMRTLLVLVLAAVGLGAATFKAGVGRADITPNGPIWFSGYAARTHASEGAVHKIWAKALAIESGPGQRIVIVSTDVVGIPRTIADDVAARVEKEHGIKRPQLLLNASHPHTGPYIWSNLNNLTVLPPGEEEKLVVYARKFADDIVAAIGAA